MYVQLVAADRLVTSDLTTLRLYDISSTPSVLAEVEQPGELPFFERAQAGERMTARAGVVARSFTPLEGDAHWASKHSRIGLYATSDLSLIRMLEPGARLDHESLALSPDGSAIASVLRGAGCVCIDAETGDIRWKLPGQIGAGTSWSADGRWIALGETDQSGGDVTLIDTQADGGPTKVVLPQPPRGCPTYDAAYRSVFSRFGDHVYFAATAWGISWVAAYDVESQTLAWAEDFESGDDEFEENWSAPELDLALSGQLVLVGLDGLIRAFVAESGVELEQLDIEGADSRHFVADSAARKVWLTKDGVPTSVPFPAAW